MESVSGGLGMMWEPSRQYEDDRDDVGTTGTTWGPWGQYVETTDLGDHMGTTWGYGDDVGMTGMTRGQRG